MLSLWIAKVLLHSHVPTHRLFRILSSHRRRSLGTRSGSSRISGRRSYVPFVMFVARRSATMGITRLLLTWTHQPKCNVLVKASVEVRFSPRRERLLPLVSCDRIAHLHT